MVEMLGKNNIFIKITIEMFCVLIYWKLNDSTALNDYYYL